MQLSKDDIRCELNKYLQIHGVKQNHISAITGLSDTTISLFLKGERELSPAKLEIICSIISEQTNPEI